MDVGSGPCYDVAVMKSAAQNWQTLRTLDQKRLAGQYVVMVEGRLIGTGRDVERLVALARKRYPGKTPHVIQVPDARRLHIYGPRAGR